MVWRGGRGMVGAILVLLTLAWAGSAWAQGLDGSSLDEAAGTASISGAVSDIDGTPITGVDVDLFSEGRRSYISSASTANDGRFNFNGLEPGCYVVTFIAPASASFEDGSSFRNVDICVADGETIDGVDATVIDQSGTAAIIAEVRQQFSGQPVGGVLVDLFTSDASGNRIEYLRTGTTLPDGRGVGFVGLAPGCYTLTFIAPDGAFFDSGSGPSAWQNLTACPDADESITRTATITGSVGTANLRVIVTDVDTNGVAGVVVDLFTASGDGTRATYLLSATTSEAGVSQVALASGCYVAVVVAPAGQFFPNGTSWEELPVCLDPGAFETVIVALAG